MDRLGREQQLIEDIGGIDALISQVAGDDDKLLKQVKQKLSAYRERSVPVRKKAVNKKMRKERDEDDSDSDEEEDDEFDRIFDEARQKQISRRDEIVKEIRENPETIPDLIDEIKTLTIDGTTCLAEIASMNIRTGMSIAKHIKDVEYLAQICPHRQSYMYSVCRFRSVAFFDEIERLKQLSEEAPVRCVYEQGSSFLACMLRQRSCATFMRMCDLLAENNRQSQINTMPLIIGIEGPVPPPLMILMNDLGKRMSDGTYSDIMKQILNRDWFESIFDASLSLMLNSAPLYLMTMMCEMAPDQIKRRIATFMLNREDYMSEPCIRKMVIDVATTDPSLYEGKNRSLLFDAIIDAPLDKLTQLMTSRGFTEEQYRYVDEYGNNCFHIAVTNRYESLPILLASNHFSRKMLTQTNSDGEDMKILVTELIESGVKDQSLKEILAAYFPEAQKTEPDYEGDSECELCAERIKNIVMVPCGHTVCSACVAKIDPTFCPYCKNEIQDRIPFYL